jgi:integrase
LATLRRRGKRWQVQVRRKGRTPVSRSFRSKTEALAWAREQEFEADKDRPQVHRTLRGITVADIVSRYRDEIVPRKRGAPFGTAGFARMVERAEEEARLSFKAHPHMLRHACGYALANKGHDTRALQAYLGHRNIQHTVRYTELSPTRFKDFWRI